MRSIGRRSVSACLSWNVVRILLSSCTYHTERETEKTEDCVIDMTFRAIHMLFMPKQITLPDLWLRLQAQMTSWFGDIECLLFCNIWGGANDSFNPSLSLGSVGRSVGRSVNSVTTCEHLDQLGVAWNTEQGIGAGNGFDFYLRPRSRRTGWELLLLFGELKCCLFGIFGTCLLVSLFPDDDWNKQVSTRINSTQLSSTQRRHIDLTWIRFCLLARTAIKELIAPLLVSCKPCAFVSFVSWLSSFYLFIFTWNGGGERVIWRPFERGVDEFVLGGSVYSARFMELITRQPFNASQPASRSAGRSAYPRLKVFELFVVVLFSLVGNGAYFLLVDRPVWMNE